MIKHQIDRPSDEQILQHLGTAVMLCWYELPLSVRSKILAQCNDVIGVRPIPGVRDKIARLILRRVPRGAVRETEPDDNGYQG
jgi:hypothetical protein